MVIRILGYLTNGKIKLPNGLKEVDGKIIILHYLKYIWLQFLFQFAIIYIPLYFFPNWYYWNPNYSISRTFLLTLLSYLIGDI